jgi:hypothetical protein
MASGENTVAQPEYRFPVFMLRLFESEQRFDAEIAGRRWRLDAPSNAARSGESENDDDAALHGHNDNSEVKR